MWIVGHFDSHSVTELNSPEFLLYKIAAVFKSWHRFHAMWCHQVTVADLKGNILECTMSLWSFVIIALVISEFRRGSILCSPPLPGSGTPKSPDEIGEIFNGFSKFSALKNEFSWRKKEWQTLEWKLEFLVSCTLHPLSFYALLKSLTAVHPVTAEGKSFPSFPKKKNTEEWSFNMDIWNLTFV